MAIRYMMTCKRVNEPMKQEVLYAVLRQLLYNPAITRHKTTPNHPNNNQTTGLRPDFGTMRSTNRLPGGTSWRIHNG